MPQQHDPLPDHPEPTLGSAIRFGRHFTNQSLRRLAKVSGVSLAQLSRLEAGQVKRPSIETLVALAAALNFHPTSLLILGGQLRGERAQSELKRLFGQAAEALEDQYGPDEVKRLLRALDEEPTDERVRDLALYAFTLDATEVEWPESLAALVPATVPDPDLLRALIEAWRNLTADRRWRLLETARDMHEASRMELSRLTK